MSINTQNMSSRLRVQRVGRVVGSIAGVLGAVAACSAGARVESTDGASADELEAGPPLPSPRDFARGLDLECYPSDGPAPVATLAIRQLNPVIKDVLPNQQIKVGEMTHTCLPVAKNNNVPPEEVNRFIKWVDLACYRAEADPVNVPVNLRHLNPVLEDLPDADVRLRQLKRFCSPVRKNFSEMEAPVRRLVEHLDFACYEFEEFTASADRNLWLSHLNPVVREFGFPNRLVHLERSKELCVPVGKNLQPIPEDVRRVVQWVDLMGFQFDALTPPPPIFPLWLSQLNPLFAGVPPVLTQLRAPSTLLVPVAKNNTPPPL